MEITQPPVRFVIRLPHSYCTAGPDAVRAVSEKADELGFFGVSVQDHIITVADLALAYCEDEHGEMDHRTIIEPMQTLALAGAVTERVKLITGVLVVPYHNAILLAKQTAALDLYSGGRLIVGVGVGAPRSAMKSDDGQQNLSAHGRVAAQEFAAMNVPGHRGRRANETLEVMRTIWADESASYDGEYYSFQDLEVYPKPVQRPGPRIWVGGRSEAARRRAVMLADGWYPSQIGSELFSQGMEWMRELAASSGRPVPRDNGTTVATCIADSDARAKDVMYTRFASRFTPEGLDTQTLWGSPDLMIEKIQRYVDVGATVFDLRLVPVTLQETLDAMDLLAAEVVPAFVA